MLSQLLMIEDRFIEEVLQRRMVIAVQVAIHMRVSRIHEYSSTPIKCLRAPEPRSPTSWLESRYRTPREGARTEFRDEFTQRFRTSGVGYDYRATGVYQMAADCGRYVSRTDKSYFHS